MTDIIFVILYDKPGGAAPLSVLGRRKECTPSEPHDASSVGIVRRRVACRLQYVILSSQLAAVPSPTVIHFDVAREGVIWGRENVDIDIKIRTRTTIGGARCGA